MGALLAFLPLAAESAAQEGRKIIYGMLIVGLVFIGVIALGQTSRWFTHRRKARKARRQLQY
jgi:heme/copper-type cytochrome/quinol oxidase subunit 2